MSSLPVTIEAYARSQPEGTVVSAKSLLHLGNRAALDQALARLARQGRLLRMGRGGYVAPVEGRFGTRAPDPAKVVRSWAEQEHETVVPHPGASANRLGLSLQVPMRPIYLTSGRSRKLRLGKLEIELRHAGPRSLKAGEGFISEAVRALEWLGPEDALARLPDLIKRMSPADCQALLNARRVMPTWLASEVSKAVGRG